MYALTSLTRDLARSRSLQQRNKAASKPKATSSSQPLQGNCWSVAEGIEEPLSESSCSNEGDTSPTECTAVEDGQLQHVVSRLTLFYHFDVGNLLYELCDDVCVALISATCHFVLMTALIERGIIDE